MAAIQTGSRYIVGSGLDRDSVPNAKHDFGLSNSEEAKSLARHNCLAKKMRLQRPCRCFWCRVLSDFLPLNCLTFNAHSLHLKRGLHQICSRTFNYFRFPRHLFVILLLVLLLLLSFRLYYCNSLLLNLLATQTNQLQLDLKAVTRATIISSKFYHIMPRVRSR